MTKIVINKCFGGFGLSAEAFSTYLTLKGIDHETTPARWPVFDKDAKEFWHAGHVNDDDYYLSDRDIPRDDPALVQAVLEATEPSGRFAALTIVNVPDEVEWQLEEYDGSEWIAEKHRTWR